MTSRPAATQPLRDLARLRRVRVRVDREYAQPLDVEALAHGVNMSAGHLSREFRLVYGESPYDYSMTWHAAVGMPSCMAKQVTKTDQESRSAGPRAATSVTAMNTTIHPTFLPHNDPDASLAVYRDTLGFEVGMRWIMVGSA